MRTLNLGIVAHVDAGKTSLTERLLYAAGVIDAVGRVDHGTTQTDTLAVERERGITVKSAVVSFEIDDVTVNLIDTPGHPDFIAEVDRVLGLLDGAIVVVSAVEGVQAQTRVLWRALQRLGVPTIIFINKIDRVGADPERVRVALVERLGAVDRPVFCGSALTGEGVDQLMRAITTHLPAVVRTSDGPLSGVVFKVEHGRHGERTAVVRLFDGTLRVRDRVSVGQPPRDAKVTRIAVQHRGSTRQCSSAVAGQIATLSGLGGARIGDVVGVPRQASGTAFAPPLFEAAIVPTNEADRRPLRAALERLAAEDPLIDLRQDDLAGHSVVSLYGDVQREVIADQLRRDFGIDVAFEATTTIHIERVVGTGEASERMLARRSPSRPFLAAVGLRVEPAEPGSGVQISAGLEPGRLPAAFVNAIEESVRQALGYGMHGWNIPDCQVTMTDSGYWPRQSHSHGTFDKNMSSTATDFRLLAPLVLAQALRQAGTEVCEPLHRARIEIPTSALSDVLRLVAAAGGVAEPADLDGTWAVLDGLMPAARLEEVRHRLPGLTGGEGSIESTFDSYGPVQRGRPERPRPHPDPRDRVDYLRQVSRRS